MPILYIAIVVSMIQPISDTSETLETHEYIDLGPLPLGGLHHHADMFNHDISRVEYSQISHDLTSNFKNQVEPGSKEQQNAVAGS